jgi:hypothetical protein
MDIVPEPESHHGHHHGHTGRHWLDIALGLSALAISLFSAALTFQHGNAMERMVEENTHMVQASTWPFLTVGITNIRPEDGKRLFKLEIVNDGVGPARVDRFTIRYKGKPVDGTRDLVDRVQRDTGRDGPNGVFFSDFKVLPARETHMVVTAADPLAPGWMVDALNEAYPQIAIEVCYCSIFDECWIARNHDRSGHPQSVKDCA